MRKTVFGCLGAAVVVFALQFTQADVQAALFSACDPCNPCNEVGPCDDTQGCDPCGAVCGTKAGKWFLNGHMEAGFFANAHGQKSTYTGNGNWFTERGADYVSGNTDLLQNTRLTGAQVNQVYISMGKAVDGRRGLDIGGTVDFTWGSDAYQVQLRGMEYAAGHGNQRNRWGEGDYYAAFAQAYVEAEYGRWNVKAGKFYAPFGSSAYKSTDNFFYSWASTAMIAPTVAGGAYATYSLNSKWDLYGGWVTPGEFGESSKNNALIGGFNWKPSKRFSLRYTFAAGKDTRADHPLYGPMDHKNLFINTLLATTQISKRLKYVFEWTLVNDNVAASSGAPKDHFAAYGINNEIIYQYSKAWAFGVRFGMLHDSDYGIVDINDDLYTVGLGANWTPTKWLIVKPEIRYDWLDKGTSNLQFDGGTSDYQFSGGLSAVVKF